MDAIILLGGPGAGKGTLAETLKTKTDFIHISTGDMFRAAMKAGTPVGLEAKAFIDRGELVPDEVVIRMIEERIKQDSQSARYMFDGFPRTIEQAKGLNELFASMDAAILHVFNLSVPSEVLIPRLTGRRTCRSCGAVYHIMYRPPKEEGVCDLDGGELYQRDDDCEKTILNRLEVYNRQTSPLIDFYKQSDLLRDVDASGDVRAIAGSVLNVIQS